MRFFPHWEPLAPQHLLDAPAAVSMPAFKENERDLLGEDGILLTPIALVLEGVIVQAAAAYSQSQAHFGDAVAGLFGFHLGDHFVKCGGSWPKIPKAFFRMSRWRLTVSSSRRNRAFSTTSAAASAAAGPPPPGGPPAAESFP